MEPIQRTVIYYETTEGKEPYKEWFEELCDERARAKIRVRIRRASLGNFGHCRILGDGVSELKVDYGPGYRVYFGVAGNKLIVLLCGGDKRTQTEDIEQAKFLWKCYRSRSDGKK